MYSWLPRVCGERLPQFVQSRTNARLDRAERLIQPRRGFGMRKPAEERRFDRLALVRRERRQCRAQRLALLAQLDHIARIGGYLDEWLRIALAALLSVLEAQAIDRPRARLVHDPAQHRGVRGVVTRRAPPDVMEDIDRELFSGFPVARDSHDQSEDDAMGHLIERMQRELVASGNRLDERRPGPLRDRSLGVG